MERSKERAESQRDEGDESREDYTHCARQANQALNLPPEHTHTHTNAHTHTYTLTHTHTQTHTTEITIDIEKKLNVKGEDKIVGKDG